MHSFDRMMALGVSIAESNALMVRLLPVASVPWRTKFGMLKRSDCRLVSIGCAMAFGTHCQKTGYLLVLELSTSDGLVER